MGSSAPPSPASPIEGYLPRLSELLEKVLRHGGFDLQFVIRRAAQPPEDFESPEVVVEFSGPDADLLLEKNAQLLDALEYVLLKSVRMEESLFGKITFDCRDWRRIRAEEIRMTAQMAAEQVAAMGKPFSLNPMNARERRIVHLALKDRPGIRTASEGFGRERKVVIHPASSPSPRSLSR